MIGKDIRKKMGGEDECFNHVIANLIVSDSPQTIQKVDSNRYHRVSNTVTLSLIVVLEFGNIDGPK